MEILDCGHPPSPHESFTTGYGLGADGKTYCYACCAERERASMVTTGRATLYLVDGCDGRPYRVTDWPGHLSFAVGRVRCSARGGGFGSQRTDAWFTGPDGRTWHAVSRGDSQIARCRRVKG